jgi:pimeloyl-ACP methyl ester carboxylesterase
MARVTANPSIVLVHGVQSSGLTWWRLRADLQDLGWQVQVVDLLGHGSRAAAGPADLTLEDLARDVLDQVSGPVDVLAGHSLGSIVALAAAGLAPDLCGQVVVEDPPGLSGALDLSAVAADIEASVRATRVDPAGMVEVLQQQNPGWARHDAENSVTNRLALDVDRVTRFLRTSRWDLPALVAGCPVPVGLLAATADSALVEPDRSALLDQLPADRVAVVASGHAIHRERPGLWLQHVLRFAEPT